MGKKLFYLLSTITLAFGIALTTASPALAITKINLDALNDDDVKVEGIVDKEYAGQEVKQDEAKLVVMWKNNGQWEKIDPTDSTGDPNYEFEYDKNKAPGQAELCLNLFGFDNSGNERTGLFIFNFNITQPQPATPQAQEEVKPFSVKAKTAKVAAKKVAKKKQVLAVSKVLNIKNPHGTLSFVKKSGNKKITINKKTGKVTIKKGLKKGTYKVKVKVTASKSGNYKKETKTVTFKIKVK